MKGADINIRDFKGRTPLDLAQENKSQNVIDMLTRKRNCAEFLGKPPLTKIENSYFNLILFIALHISVVIIAYLFLLPCNFEYNIGIHNFWTTFIYFTLFFIVFFYFIFLVKSDPGIISNKNKFTLLSFVENKMRLTDLCPLCVVK